jgi:hypothetical protein
MGFCIVVAVIVLAISLTQVTVGTQTRTGVNTSRQIQVGLNGGGVATAIALNGGGTSRCEYRGQMGGSKHKYSVRANKHEHIRKTQCYLKLLETTWPTFKKAKCRK